MLVQIDHTNILEVTMYYNMALDQLLLYLEAWRGFDYVIPSNLCVLPPIQLSESSKC